jgi:hypothetical protein
MPDVFTIYNCGTSHNRQNLDETIADLARRTVGSENRDWMISDGPGSFSHMGPVLRRRRSNGAWQPRPKHRAPSTRSAA